MKMCKDCKRYYPENKDYGKCPVLRKRVFACSSCQKIDPKGAKK